MKSENPTTQIGKPSLIVIGLGLVGIVAVSWLVPSSLTLLLGLTVAFSWVMLCLFFGRFALFLLGAIAPCLLLLGSEVDIADMAYLLLCVAMLIYAVIHFRVLTGPGLVDKKLLWCTFGLGSYLWLMHNVSRFNDGAWDLKYLLVSGLSVIPFVWFLLAAPATYRLRGQGVLTAGLVLGSLIVAVSFMLNLRPWANDSASGSLASDTYLVVGNLKNAVSLLWVIAFAMVLNWPTTRWRSLKVLGLLAFLTAITYSFSRSSYFALVVVVLLFARGKVSRRWLYILLLIGFIVIALPNEVGERLASTWSEESGFDPSSAVRLDLWLVAIDAFRSSPLLGIGIESFDQYLVSSGYIARFVNMSPAIYVYAHNYFLSLFALTGVVGGSLGLLMFGRGYWRSAQLTAQGYWAGNMGRLALAAIAAASLFGEPLFDRSLMVVFLLLLSAIVSWSNLNS